MDNNTIQRNKSYLRSARHTQYWKSIITSLVVIRDMIKTIASAMLVQIAVSLRIAQDKPGVKKRKDSIRRFASLKVTRRRSKYAYRSNSEEIVEEE